ncbi:MAG: tetratricopeptide repeat protein [Verrucomicrobia bacterium]|nr:tetratricopeptide repeat protein [Verrucomicrobiota bacterium]
MRFVLKNYLSIFAVLLVASGCMPSSSNPLDEQREPHFLTGKSRVNSMDYAGAAEAFEKALEVNPRSASAHFELGLLCENNQQDYAAAIYHFDRYLKLRPNAEYAEVVQQRIVACKQELAKSVSLAPLSQSMQRELERYSAENRDLKQKLEAWQAFYTANGGQGATPTNPPVVRATQSTYVPPPNPEPTARTAPQPTRTATAAPKPAKFLTKSYAIKSGETPASIARKYGVKLDVLLAANPGLNPSRLRVGQTIAIPAP